MVANQPGPSSVQPQGNGLAVAGMVLGILGLVLCWIPFFGWIVALVGVILSAIGWSKGNKVGKGKGMAIAGLVCGIIGLAIGVIFFVLAMTAVKGFKDYVEKGRGLEASLQLHRIERAAKSAFNEKAAFPKGSAPLPSKSCCDGPNHKCAVDRQQWQNPVWKELDFSIDEPSYYQYSYESDGKTFTAKAVGDLDCDGTPTVTELHGSVTEGNPHVEMTTPTPD